MDVSTILGLVKAKLGLSGTARDIYLKAIIDGVLKELEDEKGLVLDGTNPYHLIFVIDYVTWRYQNRDSEKGMPRHLQYRLHNLMIHVGNANLIVNAVFIVESLPVTPIANAVYIISDGTKQMYVNDVWVTVDLIDGSWVVITS
jgi:hypothetical protein